MRLLYLTAEPFPTFRPDVRVLFGAELPIHGVQSDLIAARAKGCKQEGEWGGGQALLCNPPGNVLARHVVVFFHSMKCVRAAQRARYDAIQVRDMPMIAAFTLWLARMKGIPFYYWMSYPLPEGQIALARERGLSAGFAKFLLPWLRGQIGQRLLNKVVLRHADHIFVQSDYMMRDLEKKGVPKSRMTAVPMGVDLQALSTHPVLPVDDHRLQGRRVLVYLGTLNRPRRIEVLFEMLALMRRAKIDAVLVLVGDTDDPVHRQWLQRRARESGVEHCVVWTGWLPTLEAWRYVRRADVALSPIPRGTLLDVSSPTKLPEYLALGVPVVCNDNPDQKAIMDSTGSGKCVPYTAHEFASAAIELLSLDEETRACMIRRGQRFVEERRSYRLLAKVLAERYASLSEQRTEGRPTSLPT